MKITLSLLLAAGLTSAAVAAGKASITLSHGQCDKLYELWWQAEDQLTTLRGCRTIRCYQAQSDLAAYQSQIAGLWAGGQCDRHYGIHPL